MTPYQNLENRIFGKEFLHEGSRSHYQYASAIPVGTLLAQSFDMDLIREVGEMIGGEMQEFGVTLWLAPGMNIHRNPLCGRNFEYYSEDPLVSGMMAAALTLGVQSLGGTGTTIKHFACNNQEENRRGVSSIVSERALREIYLKGFEIAVKASRPMSIMTSYNKVNSVHTANSYDLCTTAARKEWGFTGIIMTDWTTTNSDGGSSAAKCIAAGNDLVMPGLVSDIREIIGAVNKEDALSLDESLLDACAERMVSLILASNAYEGAASYLDGKKLHAVMRRI
jgi:beta-glucosidase